MWRRGGIGRGTKAGAAMPTGAEHAFREPACGSPPPNRRGTPAAAGVVRGTAFPHAGQTGNGADNAVQMAWTGEFSTNGHNSAPRQRLIHLWLAKPKCRRDRPADSTNGGTEMLEHLILLPLIMLLIRVKIKIRIVVKKHR